MQTSPKANFNPNFPSIFSGLDFLLKHLCKPEFPRTVATKTTEGKQTIVASREEALGWYHNTELKDCRLSAYPYTLHTIPQIIDFILLDLDLNNFKQSRQKLDSVLKRILTRLYAQGCIPTVLWTGNGYHILIPVEPLPCILEQMPEFSRFTEPSKKILRWLEKYLSSGKSDSVHNSTVSFANCMLRVPGSYNSKHDDGNNQVKIVQEWDGKRLGIMSLLLGDFLVYLMDLQDKEEAKQVYRKNYYSRDYNYNGRLSK